MSDELVYTGPRCIRIVRDAGRQYEAWTEPGREDLGRLNTCEQACRAIYDHDRTAAADGRALMKPEQQAEGAR